MPIDRHRFSEMVLYSVVDDSDDDNASFFSAKSSGDDEFYASSALPPFAEAAGVNKASPEAPLSLTNVDTIDAARSDAAKTKLPLSISTTFHSSLPGVPGDDLDGGREVPIESGIQMEEMMDDSSSTASSSGRMLASPETSGELDTVQVASSPATRENPAVTGDEDLVNPLAEEKEKVQPVTPGMGNHEFLQFERTLDSEIIEINVAEQTVRVSEDSRLGDAVLSHLPVSGAASAVVYSEVEIVQESMHCEIKEKITSTKINTEDTGRSAAVIARASPDLAMRPELVPVPQDKGDLTIVPETTAHSVVAEQAIRVVESQTTDQGFIPQALDVGGEHAPPSLPGGSPVGSVEVTQEHSTSLLQEKSIDAIDIQTTGQDINAESPPGHTRGESLSPRPPNEPSNATTGEPRVQEPPLSSLVQKGSPAAGPAKQVQESADGGVEMMLQQFFQMAERMSSQSGDTERSPQPQAKPVNFVINVTNNHISTVAHGAGGDNYYGPIGQSAIGGQGGHNDIKNHQTKEIKMIASRAKMKAIGLMVVRMRPGGTTINLASLHLSTPWPTTSRCSAPSLSRALHVQMDLSDDLQPKQGIYEGGCVRTVVTCGQPPQISISAHKYSLPPANQSNVEVDHSRSRSRGLLTLQKTADLAMTSDVLESPRESVRIPVPALEIFLADFLSLLQETVSETVVATQHRQHPPDTANPEYLERALTADTSLPQSGKPKSHNLHITAQRATSDGENREQPDHSGSPDFANLVASPTKKVRPPKKINRRRILRKLLDVLLQRRSVPADSVPHKPEDVIEDADPLENDQPLPMPSGVRSPVKTCPNQQGQIQAHPSIGSDEDLIVHPFAGRKRSIQAATLDVDNHESALFHRRSTISVNTTEKAIDQALGDVRLSPLLPLKGTPTMVQSEAEVKKESTYHERYARNNLEASQDMDVGAAHPLLDLVFLEPNQEKLRTTSRTLTQSMVKEQTILGVTLESGSRLLDTSDKPQLPKQAPEPLAISGVDNEESSTSTSHEKHMNSMLKTGTIGEVIKTMDSPEDACDEQNLPPSLTSSGPSDTSETGVQGFTPSVVQRDQTVITQPTAPAVNVHESKVESGPEVLAQQFLRMVERFTNPAKKNEIAPNDGLSEGDLEWLFPVNIVVNFTQNHINSVAHGAAGDNYYGPIGQSAVGGQGGHSDIRNHQTKEITHTAQSYGSQTHPANTANGH
ncbi:hypothetical protein EYR40_008991 [Pleurotus pulmonarius]|nr:hypothetical protein EYR40_008991 [Pleurotus pulmonarius]